MKISDFIFQFPTCCGTRYDAICRVRIFVTKNQDIYAILTDLGEKNTGSSVTNTVEGIREHLILKGYISLDTNIIEHYEKSQYRNHTFDLVKFDDQNNPSWENTILPKIIDLTESTESEFEQHSFSIKRLFDEIEEIRYKMDPFIDEPYHEDFNIINRREDIYNNMLSKQTLQDAIDNNEIEQNLQALLKSDLSIIADIYSNPKEEYICFSEFPVNDGFVDFVLFSGRSRMDVTLIEIKGANYSLINKNQYQDFSAKTNQAVQQIKKRLGYITRNYEVFRKFTHDVRKEVESGATKYNSFVGPKGNNLYVDSNKDISLHTIVIGGRSKNDIEESELRHNYEYNQSPPIKIESWDSWLKKVQR